MFSSLQSTPRGIVQRAGYDAHHAVRDVQQPAKQHAALFSAPDTMDSTRYGKGK
jgi:hypothetical protein